MVVSRLVALLLLMVAGEPVSAAYLHFTAGFNGALYYTNVADVSISLDVALSDTPCDDPIALGEPIVPIRTTIINTSIHRAVTTSWCYRGVADSYRLIGLYASAAAGGEVTLHTGGAAVSVPVDTVGDCKSAVVLLPHSGYSGVRTCKTGSNSGFYEIGPSFVPLTTGAGNLRGGSHMTYNGGWYGDTNWAAPAFLQDGVGIVGPVDGPIRAQYLAGFDDRPLRYLVYRATLNTSLSQVDDNYLTSTLQIADSCPSTAIYYPSISYTFNSSGYYLNEHCIAGVPGSLTLRGYNGSTLTLNYGDPPAPALDRWTYLAGSKNWHFFGLRMPDRSLFYFGYCAYICTGQRLVGYTPLGEYGRELGVTNLGDLTWYHQQHGDQVWSTYRWDL